MRKVLPVSRTPITTYPHTANLAAVLWNEEKIYPWLLNCFMKVYGWCVEDEDYNIDYEDFYILDCPAILCERINSQMMLCGWTNPLAFIHDAIDLSYYIYLVVDTSKITAYNNNRRFFHDIFIYGYDDTLKILYALDCFKNGKYGSAQITYSEFSAAYSYGEKYYQNIFEFHDDIILIKPNREASLDFHITRFKESIVDFLNGTPSRYTYSRLKVQCPTELNNYFFGKDYYNILYKHLQYCSQHGELSNHTMRVFHLAYELKAVMCERLQYLIKHRIIFEGEQFYILYEKMQQEMQKIQYMLIKFQITQNVDIIRRIQYCLKEVESSELMCLEHIHRSLSSVERYAD